MRFTSEDLWTLLRFANDEHHEAIVASVLQSNWDTDSCTVDIRRSSEGGLPVVHVRIGNDIIDEANAITWFLLNGCCEELEIGFKRVFIHINHFLITDRPFPSSTP